MSIPVEDIKKLRDITGAGMMDAKKALETAGGDMQAAQDALRKKGAASAAKRADREAKEGIVTSYIHGDKIGVLVELNCETDFVARTEDFKTLARDIAMHVAASAPEYLDPESVPADVLQKERDFHVEQVKDKPADIQAKIIDGKLAKYYETITLVKQPFVKDPDTTIEELITTVSAKLGEKIAVRQYSRIELGGQV